MKKMKSNKKKLKGGDDESLTENDIYKITDLYFSQENILYSHQIDSFNYF